MAPFANSPKPRRTVYERRQTPPQGQRRPFKPGPSRLATPARAGSRRLSSLQGDVSMSDLSVGMDVDVDADVDADEEEGVERGLKFETIFAKSAELQVSFYAHLPAEVKLVLRHAGAYALCGSGRGFVDEGGRLLP